VGRIQVCDKLLDSKIAVVIYSNCQILKEVSLCHCWQNTLHWFTAHFQRVWRWVAQCWPITEQAEWVWWLPDGSRVLTEGRLYMSWETDNPGRLEWRAVGCSMHEPKTWSFWSSYCSSWVRIMVVSFCGCLLHCDDYKHFLGKLKQ
jgi:hypothetical protein